MARVARYDGVADWYDEYVGPGGGASAITALADDLTIELLGPGHGRCLEIGCGGGTRLPMLAGLGWSAVGLDLSADQLRVARSRLAGAAPAPLVLADATRLPVATASCDAVTSTMVVTDLEDLTGAVTEMSRVLWPGGRLVLVGPHPCFSMCFVTRSADGPVTVREGYRDRRWLEDAALLGDGIRRRVGTANVPLPALLNPLLEAGLVLDHVAEDSGPDAVPLLLGIRAHLPA